MCRAAAAVQCAAHHQGGSQRGGFEGGTPLGGLIYPRYGGIMPPIVKHRVDALPHYLPPLVVTYPHDA